MDAKHVIRAAVAEVENLRRSAANQHAMGEAVAAIKQIQSRRFEHSYSDLLQGGPYQAAARFFLCELYGNTDYSERDAQFAKIAGAIESLLPQAAIATAIALAKLHALTEQLDYCMALAWERDRSTRGSHADRYVRAWRATGRREDRLHQLRLVVEIGNDLDKLTKTPGLRLLLKLMRGPAHAAGLQELQRFLELGFDTFATMNKRMIGVRGFLDLIEIRETEIIDALFAAEGSSRLSNALGQ